MGAPEVQPFKPSEGSESGSERLPVSGVCEVYAARNHEAADEAGPRWIADYDGVEDQLTS